VIDMKIGKAVYFQVMVSVIVVAQGMNWRRISSLL